MPHTQTSRCVGQSRTMKTLRIKQPRKKVQTGMTIKLAIFPIKIE